MRKLMILIAIALGCVMSWRTAPQAQSAKLANWLTDGGDIARTGWQRNETILSTSSVKT